MIGEAFDKMGQKELDINKWDVETPMGRSTQVRWDVRPDSLTIEYDERNGYFVSGRPSEHAEGMENRFSDDFYLWRNGTLRPIAYHPDCGKLYDCGWYHTRGEAERAVEKYRRNRKIVRNKFSVHVHPDKLIVKRAPTGGYFVSQEFATFPVDEYYLWADGVLRKHAVSQHLAGKENHFDELKHNQGYFATMMDANDAIRKYRRHYHVSHETPKYFKEFTGKSVTATEVLPDVFAAMKALSEEKLTTLDRDIRSREIESMNRPKPAAAVLIDRETGDSLGKVEEFDVELREDDGEGEVIRSEELADIVDGAEMREV